MKHVICRSAAKQRELECHSEENGTNSKSAALWSGCKAVVLSDSMPKLRMTTSVHVQGSCGYGSLKKDTYPFWSVAALSTSNRFYKAGPINGCGECFEIRCQNSGGKFAVSFTATCLSSVASCEVAVRTSAVGWLLKQAQSTVPQFPILTVLLL